MEYALIKNSRVENIIVADDSFINLINKDWDHIESLDTAKEQSLSVSIGWAWDGKNFIPPEIPPRPEPEVPTWKWYIDIGPFFDRFGTAKMAVLTSADVGVQAILKDTQVRKWVDLKHPNVASSIAYIGTKVPALTTALQTSILNTPVAETENLALRKLYFS